MIVDKGRESKESFFVEVLSSDSDEILDSTKCDSENEHNFNALHEFIDDRFYSILVNKIISEVKLALNESIKHDYIENVKHTNDKNEITSKDNKCLED